MERGGHSVALSRPVYWTVARRIRLTQESFGTTGAARYLSQRGVRTSTSTLEKLRLRGSEDPRDPGPDFSRDSLGRCWYSQEALDSYIERRLADRQFRAPAAQPANLRRGQRGE